MAENPLLPDAELRALRTATKRAHKVEAKFPKTIKKPQSPPSSREALLAATLMQLLPGDTIVPEPGDTAVSALTSAENPKAPSPIASLQGATPETHLLSAAGLAAACKRSGGDKLVLAFTQVGLTNITWSDAFSWAQREDLPLIVTVADPSGADAFQTTSVADPTTLTWTSLRKLARKLHLPVLSVDGEDAVAVYRVMQESVLRARSGAGPAILWAMLPTPDSLQGGRPSTASPLRRLERYLKTRSISF